MAYPRRPRLLGAGRASHLAARTAGLSACLRGRRVARRFSLLAWKRQDEFERAAQKFSWVFGGLFGLLVSLAFLPVATQPGVALSCWAGSTASLQRGGRIRPRSAVPAFLLGAVYIALGQLVGFLVCWVGWHVTKR